MIAIRLKAALVIVAGLCLNPPASAATGTLKICTSVRVLLQSASANFGSPPSRIGANNCANATATFTSGTNASGYVEYAYVGDLPDCPFYFQTNVTNGSCSVTLYTLGNPAKDCYVSGASYNSKTCDFTGNATINVYLPERKR